MPLVGILAPLRRVASPNSIMSRQIRNILKQGIETPEDQNDLRKMQLRELARLNGTLREDDNRSAKGCFRVV